MNANSPLVSVVMPVYNAKETVGRALCSLINQTYRNIEIIVVNDGSTDCTADVVLGFSDSRIRLISYEQNLGRPKARQIGLDACEGEFLAMLDSDDWWVYNKLQSQLSYFESDPDLVCVSSGMFIVDELDILRGVRVSESKKLIHDLPFRINVPHAPSLIRMDAVKGSEYDARLKYSQDSDFLRRCLQGKAYIIANKCLYVYSEIGSVTSRKYISTQMYMIASYFKWFKMFPISTIRYCVVASFKLITSSILAVFGLHCLALSLRSKKPSERDAREYDIYLSELNQNILKEIDSV